MAAKDVGEGIDSVVNRWIVDYYSTLALRYFQEEQYEDFCDIRLILDKVLARPTEESDAWKSKIAVLQFLSRINEGESLDMSFESDQLSPLESALLLLGHIKEDLSISQRDFDNACTAVKEMMVIVFLKNNEFDKAKEMLNKHFPKPMVDKKAIFMGLIRQKSKTHKIIEQADFQQFRQQMFAFCQKLFQSNVPFLHKAARGLIDQRLGDPDEEAAGPDEQDEPGPSGSPQVNFVQLLECKPTIIQRIRLEVAYNALATDSNEISFAKLEEEVENEQEKTACSLCLSASPTHSTSENSEQDGLFQRDSGSPMEASPADQPPQTDNVDESKAGSLSKAPPVLRNRPLYTLSRLVVEPDSQRSSQCTPTQQEPEPVVRVEETLPSPAVPNEEHLQNPVAEEEVVEPARRLRRHRASASSAVFSADSEEGSSASVRDGEGDVEEIHDKSNTSLSRKGTKSARKSSSSEEEDAKEPETPGRHRKQPARKDPSNTDSIHISDSSSEGSSSPLPLRSDPQTSSTPKRDCTPKKSTSKQKWKTLLSHARESKEMWSDEETYFTSAKSSGSHNDSTISNSGHRKRKWTDSETRMLKEGVKKFGEGSWSKILQYYSFKDRSNVNLKDRWRTMKKANMI